MENNNSKIDEIVEKAMLYLKKIGWDDRFTQHIKNMATKKDAAVIFSKLEDKLCEDKNGWNICKFVKEVDNISNKDVVKLFVVAYFRTFNREYFFDSFNSKIENLSFADVEQILNDLKFTQNELNEFICYMAPKVKSLTHENKVVLMNKLGDDDRYICEFAERVGGLTHDDLVVLLDKLGNKFASVVRFTLRVKGLTHDDLVKIMRRLIDSKDINHIIYFASADGLTHDDKVVLMKNVIKYGNVGNIVDFALYVKGLTSDDIIELLEEIIKTRDIKKIVFVVENSIGLTDDDYDLIVRLAKGVNLDLSESFNKSYPRAIDYNLTSLIDNL